MDTCAMPSTKNPLACTAGLTVMQVLLEGRVLDHAKRMGDYLAKGLQDCKDRQPSVKEVRGLGLLQGMELAVDGKTVVEKAQSRGLLLNCTMDRVLRFVPPLVITQAEIDRLLDVLPHLIPAAAQTGHH